MDHANPQTATSRCSPHCRRAGDQRGMVTAELAVGLLAVGMVLTLCCWVLTLVVVQTRCEDTASQVARQLARGDTAAARQAEHRAPKGSEITRRSASGTVTVKVQVERSLGSIGPVQLSGDATADLEPGVTA